MVLISFITGHFKNIFYFTLIVLIHELGHSMTGLIFKFKLKRIEIYPYGGCSKLEYDINTQLIKEFIVLIMGPLMQIVFIYVIRYFVDSSNLVLFERYSRWILYFNLLPIFPLDGGKLINLVLCKFISYYKSYQITIYLSYFLFLSCLLVIIFFHFNLILFLIFIVFGVTLFREIKKTSFYYHRFLIERYINHYHFKYLKNINRLDQMKRDTVHIISNVSEKE